MIKVLFSLIAVLSLNNLFLKNRYDQSKSYSSVRNSIKNNRLHLNRSYASKNIKLDSVSRYLHKVLTSEIFPFWYGTKWSFEGHTDIPKQGEIACGYFVSTTLKHVGFNLNRYSLAQKSPYNEALFISQDENILVIEGRNSKEIISEITCLIDTGLYFLGLDENHVGYLDKEGNEIYIIHSNYLEPSTVIKERIENSIVFKSYLKFYLVPISNNKKLIKMWLSNTPLK